MTKQFSACPLCGRSRSANCIGSSPLDLFRDMWSAARIADLSIRNRRTTPNQSVTYYRDPGYHDSEYWSFEEQAERALRQILDTGVSVLGHPISFEDRMRSGAIFRDGAESRF